MTQTAFVTGANRGIGLEHCRRFAERGWQVVAAARNPERALQLQDLALAYADRLEIVRLDVTDDGAVAAISEKLSDRPIDILVNNAGTFGPRGAPEGAAYQSLAHMDYGIWRQILEVNLLAPFRMSVALASSLRRSTRPLIVMMSSDLGSIANNHQGQSYAYRSSKAGLNMLTRGMAMEWKEFTVVSMAPGWCRTELGGSGAPVDPIDSVRAQQEAFDRLTPADSGSFLDRFGKPVKW